jgi:hypothetical protein
LSDDNDNHNKSDDSDNNDHINEEYNGKYNEEYEEKYAGPSNKGIFLDFYDDSIKFSYLLI